jgi:hypothetical protein
MSISSFQVEQLQLDSMIMAEDRSRERGSSSNVPAPIADMDSTEKVNKETLDLTVSSLKGKEISVLHDILQLGIADSYVDIKTKVRR